MAARTGMPRACQTVLFLSTDLCILVFRPHLGRAIS
nr:MAG TPA: hypothetical protein [Caudoviricetes sp.]